MLFTFFQGLAMEARVQNNLEVLRNGLSGAFELLGVRVPAHS